MISDKELFTVRGDKAEEAVKGFGAVYEPLT